MLITIEGKYQNGQISLAEAPAGVQEAKVIVTFFPDSGDQRHPSRAYFGMFKGARTTEPEDFKLAEWREESGN